MCVASNKAGRGQVPIPLEPRDARHGTIGLDVFSMGFWSCFGPIFPCYAPIPPFWNEDRAIVTILYCNIVILEGCKFLNISFHKGS